MRVLSIIDSFKGTLTSLQLGQIMSEELNKKGIEADYIPISDGGDGFLDVIEMVVKTKRVEVTVSDPLGRKIQTYFLFDKKTQTAYLELAKSSGINLLSKSELNPFVTSTFGLGETIDQALAHGAKKMVVGIGGSATNDGGSGMLEALGCRFFDAEDHLLSSLSGRKLDRLCKIDDSDFLKKIAGVEFLIASDVTNPLLGKKGATYIFAKQKGAKAEELSFLEGKMENYATAVEQLKKKDFRTSPGAGAAGGVGFAFKSMFKASFLSGIEYILDLVHFETLIQNYDVIITGEGKIDQQSFDGKVVFGISQRAQNKKIVLVCALCEVSEAELKAKNIHKLYSIVDSIASVEESMNHPAECFRKLCDSIKF
jgi:glycerate kinase